MEICVPPSLSNSWSHILAAPSLWICCVHCLCPKQLALFLCREGCGSYMHQAHSSSSSLSSLVKPHNFCALFYKGSLSYAIRSLNSYVSVCLYLGYMLLINIEYMFEAFGFFIFFCAWGRRTKGFNEPEWVHKITFFPRIIIWLRKSI